MRTLALLVCQLLLSSASLAATDLLRVYEQALASDPRISIARLELAIGEEQYKYARGQLLPQVSAAANLSDNEVDFRELDLPTEDYNGERYSLTLRQTLFDWERLSRRARAKEAIAQREAELLDAMAEMLVDVSERYFQVLLANDELELVRTELELAVRQQAAVQRQFERSLVPVTQVYETNARADRIRSDEIQARTNLELAKEELAVLTGSQIGELVSLRDAVSFPSLSQELAALTDQAISNNPGLKARQQAVIVAEKQIEEMRADHLPRVDLVLSQQRSDVGYDNQQTPERDTQYIGVDVTVPLYTGGSTSAGVREARHMKSIAEQELEATRREVVKATRDAYLNSRSSYQRIDATARAVESAEKAYDAMQKSFSYGTVTSVDVLEALHRQTQARRDHQQARYEYIGNYLRLRRQTGDVSVEDLTLVNSWLSGG